MSPTDDKKPASEGPGEKAKKRRPGRRPATIDLAATEVKAEEAKTAGKDAGASDGAKKTAEKASKPAESASKPAQQATAAKSAETPSGAAKPASGKAEEAAKKPQGTAARRPQSDWTGDRNLMLGVFAAGAVIGGLVALGAYAGLVQLGLMPGAGRDMEPVEARIDALRSDIETEIAGLRADLPGDAVQSLSADVRQLSQRVQAVEETLAEVPTEDRLSSVEDRIAALGARLTQVETEAEAGRDEVRGLIEKMAASGESEAARAAITALTRRLDSVEEAAKAETERQVASVRADTENMIGTNLDDLSREMADLRAELASLRETAGEKTAALAAALTGLEQTVNSGAPFDHELATVEALVGPREEIAALKDYASDGVARPTTLRDDFQDAASAAMSAGAPQSEGFVDRLIADARRIIRIRPTGDVEGDTTGAILARAETKLEAGDLAAALEELAALDAKAQVAMSGWLERARARQEAERLVAALNEEVLSGLSAGEGTDAP